MQRPRVRHKILCLVDGAHVLHVLRALKQDVCCTICIAIVYARHPLARHPSNQLCSILLPEGIHGVSETISSIVNMKVCHVKQPSSQRTVRCCAEPVRPGRRAVLSLLPLLAAAAPAVAAAPPGAVEIEPFLKSSGAKGPLAEEEEVLFQLRKEKELLVRDELEKERSVAEADARASQRGLYVYSVSGHTESFCSVAPVSSAANLCHQSLSSASEPELP